MVERSAYPKPLFGAGTLPLLKRFNLSQGSIKKSESIFHTGRFPSFGNVSFLLSFIVCVCEFTVCTLGHRRVKWRLHCYITKMLLQYEVHMFKGTRRSGFAQLLCGGLVCIGPKNLNKCVCILNICLLCTIEEFLMSRNRVTDL